MRCWRSLLSAGFALLLLSACGAPGGELRVLGTAWRDDAAPVLEVRLGARFTPALLAALDQGIPLTLEFTLEFDAAPPIRVAQELELSYSPLSARYRLRDLASGAERSFAHRALLLAALDRVSIALPAAGARPPPGAAARLRVSLAAARLPAPLRLPALVSPEWRLAAADHRFNARG